MRTARISLQFMLAAAAACLFSITASADTLELKNGQRFHGQYSGGSDDTIRFIIDGDIRVFHLDEITSLHFGADDQNSTPISAPLGPTPAAPATPPNAVSPETNPPDANPPAADQSSAPPPPSQPPAADQSAAPPALPADAVPPVPAPIAPVPLGDRITVPIDTPVTVRMIDSIDSSVDQPGKRFHATLDQDLLVNGVVIAPKGTDVYGRLTYASQAGHIQGRAELRLELTSIMINGKARPLSTGEYHLAGKSRSKQSAERIGGAAIGGAIIGGILGGGQGAAAGAAIGAGAGTTVQLATEGPQVKIPSETRLEFKLSAPLITEPAEPSAPTQSPAH